MGDTHHDDEIDRHHGVDKQEDPQGWGQCQYNSWTKHGITYGNFSGVGLTSQELSILTLPKNMHVEQRELHEEDSRRRDEFEVAQTECFKEVHENLTTHDNNFNNVSSHSTMQFNEIRQNMASNHVATQAGICDMIRDRNENHRHYNNFKEKCVISWIMSMAVKVFLGTWVGGLKFKIVEVEVDVVVISYASLWTTFLMNAFMFYVFMFIVLLYSKLLEIMYEFHLFFVCLFMYLCICFGSLQFNSL